MSVKNVAVVGASGNIGRKLVDRLLAEGVRVRAIARDPKRLAGAAAGGAEVHAGSVRDAAFLAGAFRGADAAFTMIPPAYDATDFLGRQDEVGEALARALVESGVPRVVNLSSVGAHLGERTGPILALHRNEARLNATAIPELLHLRPAYFMENHLAGIGLIRSQGIHGSAIGADVPIAQIATADIAGRAAERLLSPSLARRSYDELLGPADVTMAGATKVLGAAIGRPDLPYVAFPYDAAEGAMKAGGMSAAAARSLGAMARGFNEAWIGPERPRGPESTTPTTLDSFARSVFAPAFASA